MDRPWYPTVFRVHPDTAPLFTLNGRKIKVFLDAGIEKIAKVGIGHVIEAHGGEIMQDIDAADIILTVPTIATTPILDKPVLHADWVKACLEEPLFYGADRNWGGFLLRAEFPQPAPPVEAPFDPFLHAGLGLFDEDVLQGLEPIDPLPMFLPLGNQESADVNPLAPIALPPDNGYEVNPGPVASIQNAPITEAIGPSKSKKRKLKNALKETETPEIASAGSKQQPRTTKSNQKKNEKKQGVGETSLDNSKNQSAAVMQGHRPILVPGSIMSPGDLNEKARLCNNTVIKLKKILKEAYGDDQLEGTSTGTQKVPKLTAVQFGEADKALFKEARAIMDEIVRQHPPGVAPAHFKPDGIVPLLTDLNTYILRVRERGLPRSGGYLTGLQRDAAAVIAALHKDSQSKAD